MPEQVVWGTKEPVSPDKGRSEDTGVQSNTWRRVKEEIGDRTLSLGPYFTQQLLDSPRHLLFTLSRYKFAARQLPQDSAVDVLELGCSEGIGTLMLAEKGHRVTAVDFDGDAIRHANETLNKPNITFVDANFLGGKFGDFYAAISIDVIEHIYQTEEDSFFETIRINLDADGICLVGTPNITAAQYASTHSQIGHVNLFTAERLVSLMKRYFQHVFLFGMNDEVVHTGFYPMCHYLLALGSGKRSRPLG